MDLKVIIAFAKQVLDREKLRAYFSTLNFSSNQYDDHLTVTSPIYTTTVKVLLALLLFEKKSSMNVFTKVKIYPAIIRLYINTVHGVEIMSK